MSDNLTILDDILNCGFTAPRLADMANANHLSIVAIADQVQAILKQKTHFAVFTTACVDSETNVPQDANRNFVLRTTSFLDNVSKPLRAITFKIRSGNRTGKFTVRGSNNTNSSKAFIDMSFKTFHQIIDLPEHCQLNTLRLGSEFDLPYVVAIDEKPLWDDKLEKTRMAPEIREQLLDSVKVLLGEKGNNDSVCDVMWCPSRRRDNKQSIAEFASLFSGKRITKSMKRDEVEAALDSAPMNDLGITNIDDLACVIYLAAVIFELGCYWGTRANLCNLEGFYKMRKSDFEQQLKARGRNPHGKELLCQFIEFCGGKVPSTICWRREKGE
jgi:hypothetical protein